MPLDKTHIKDFIKTLILNSLLTESDVHSSFEIEGGIDEILKEGFIIFGYEALGWEVGERNTSDDIKSFFQNHHEVLEAFPDERYYFIAAVISRLIPRYDPEVVEDVLSATPKVYTEFLKRLYVI